MRAHKLRLCAVHHGLFSGFIFDNKSLRSTQRTPGAYWILLFTWKTSENMGQTDQTGRWLPIEGAVVGSSGLPQVS